MKLLTSTLVLASSWEFSHAFVSAVPGLASLKRRQSQLAVKSSPLIDSLLQRPLDDSDIDGKLDVIAHKFRLQCFDVDTGVYGMESKDPDFGIETIRTFLHIDDGDMLGIELTEVAHGNDHRGLVLVSGIHGDAKVKPIQIGDTIIGVFCGEGFKESTTGMDYDETVKVLNEGKAYARSVGGSTISVELNRLVPRAHVQVLVEGSKGETIEIDGKAGDNLRLLLLHNNLSDELYKAHTHRLDQPTLTTNCGGEGICGTCLVQVNEGLDHCNKIGPQESSILKNRPKDYRAACKCVIGADNQDGTVLRIRLHPQTGADDKLLP
jgi:ferredoxin